MRIAKSAFLAATLTAVSACDGGSSSDTASQPLAVAPSSGQEVEPSRAPKQASFCAQPTGSEPKAAGAAYTDGICPRPKGDPVDIFVWAAPQLTSINLSPSTLTLDRWGDTATIAAQPVDQNGNDLNSATIVWSSSDDTVIAVDDAGNVTSWLDGDVELTVEASLDGITISEAVTVTVAIQQNSNCTVPTQFPVKGPVNPPSTWDVRRVPTQFLPDGAATGQIEIMRGVSLDADRDGDFDLILAVSTPQSAPPVSVEDRIWLNDGSGTFTDGTDSILGSNTIPWNQPRRINYADIDGDGFRDAVLFQHGWETGLCGQGGCLGAPNMILSPQPGDFGDSAPTRLTPYEPAYSHSGALADIDCDGDVDIFEGNWPNGDIPKTNDLYVNSGSGDFVSEVSLLPNELQQPWTSADATFCDLDRDGDADLVTSYAASSLAEMRISVNDGFGQFRMINVNGFPVAGPIPYWDLGCDDLDLDGYNDVIITREDDSGAVYRNLGNMSFEDVTDAVFPPDPKGLPGDGTPIVDLNGDGWPDITPSVANAIYWNTGDGIFVSGALPGLCCGAVWAVADYDQDGRPDIHNHFSGDMDWKNNLFLNRPSPAPVKLVFATSGLYTGDLGGLAGADAKCQQHASTAGLPGTYVAFMSDSSVGALERIAHGEFRRVGDNALVANSKVDFMESIIFNAINRDESGNAISTNTAVRTGSDAFAYKNPGPITIDETGERGFCSDWTRATNETPGIAAKGTAGALQYGWIFQGDVSCSTATRLYCFQQ